MRKYSIVIIFIILFITILIIFGCASQGIRYYTPSSTVSIDTLRKITDDDIKKALESQPQLILPINLAIYSAGSEDKDFFDTLKHNGKINNIYKISPALIEGERYYLRKRRPWFYDYVNLGSDLQSSIFDFIK